MLMYFSVYVYCGNLLQTGAKVEIQMANTDGLSNIVEDKLDKNNFHAWKFRMTNFLMGKGYWEYINGEMEEMLELPKYNPTTAQVKAFKD